MRRREPAPPVDPEGRPTHLVDCRIADWTTGAPSDLDCDSDGRCLISRDSHEWSCGLFTAQRRWHAARMEWSLVHGTSMQSWPPHGRPH